MIIVTNQDFRFGSNTKINFCSARGIDIDPPQPVMITRIATRDEFMSYWYEKFPAEFQRSIKFYGEPPNDAKYYEVTTD